MLIHGRIFSLDRPVVMGIINITPDSFYAASRKRTAAEIASQAEKMLSDGAAILDIGACSTRPGCAEVSAGEEMSRLLPALKAVREVSADAVISVDTFRADVARRSVEDYGAGIINDVSGGCDSEMFATVADLHVPYVLSHIQGPVREMQNNCRYADLVPDMLRFLAERLQQLHLMGVADVIVDPGLGFSKTVEQSWEVLANLDVFASLGCPVMAGLSRKSMLWKPLGITADEALNATTAAHLLALQGGASILRAHDVKEAAQSISIYNLAAGHRKQ